MKKSLFWLAVVMLCCAAFGIGVSAETEGYYTYTVSNGEATITKVKGTISGDVTLPNTLGGYPVTVIGDSAFSNCDRLTSITIPYNVISIGNFAFNSCDLLTSITLPDSVTSIGYDAFIFCYALTNITIPNSVTSIGSEAFRDCHSLTSISISNSVISIGSLTFYNCINLKNIDIPNSVTSIGRQAFQNCTNLTSIVISDSVASIGNQAFVNCSNLTIQGYTDSYAETYAKANNIPFQAISTYIASGTCGDSLTWTLDEDGTLTICGTGAMWDFDPAEGDNRIITPWDDYSSKIINAVIEDGVTSIGNYAFYCSNLANIIISDSVLSIGWSAFDHSDQLTSVLIPDSVISIGQSAFASCTNLAHVTIPHGITSIEYGTFENCKSLTSVTIPDSVTSIGMRSFMNCNKLMSVTIPNSVTSIGECAFGLCSDLASITIPNSVTSIGTCAFVWCENLKDVFFYGDIPPEWSALVFNSSREDVPENLTLYYSEGNTSGWTTPTWTAPDGSVYNTQTFIPEPTFPTVTAVSVSPVSGTISDTYTFTAQATGTDKVAFYVDTYHLGTVTGANGVFTFSHSAFTATGNRTVYAYPCDAAGQPIMTEGSYASAAFTIAQAPRLDPVTITSSSYRTSLINTAVDLSWVAPSNAPGDTRYNIYVYSDGSQVGTVITTTALSCVISADYFTQEGEYMLEVLGAAEGWESGFGRAVTVSVRTAQPTLNDFALDRTTVSLDGSVRLSGFINGNGGLIAKVTVTVLNTDINDGGTIWTNQSLNVPYFDLSAVPALAASNPAFKGAGNYKVRVFVKMQGAEDADMLGNASLSVLTDARFPLVAPVVTGSESVTAGDNYQLSWIPVANADYYELTIDGTSYKEIIEGNTATIPGKTLKNLTGAQTATTLKLRLVVHSNDTDTWLPSSAAVKTITVLPEVQSRAMILGVTMKNYTVVAGTAAEFTVTTTTDVTAIRMKDGAGSFIVGTWNTGYVDKNGERIWTVTQQINDPGVNNQRVLTFYSMIGDTEYNKCDVGFTCVVTAAIGSFEIMSPAHESKQAEKHDLSITWNAPANVAVDYYIVRVYHGEACVLQQDVPAQNPAPVVIPGALLVRDNEAYQVRITARKVGHAESTAVSRFTLICPHENTYQPVEKMSYVSATPYIHMVDITTSYACADCGQKNVKNETKTTSQGHTCVNLDNGGRVCNLCWYMEGVVEDTKEYKLNPDVASSKERVYSSVGADGEPYGIQYAANGAERQIFDTDVITVLGTKGLCYFVKYPVGNNGEYHYGFVKREMLAITGGVQVPIIKTATQVIVENFIDEYYDKSNKSSYTQPMRHEFTTANDVAEILSRNDDYWHNVKYNLADLGNAFENNAKAAVDAVFGTSILYKDFVYNMLLEALQYVPTYKFDQKIVDIADSMTTSQEKVNAVGDLILTVGNFNDEFSIPELWTERVTKKNIMTDFDTFEKKLGTCIEENPDMGYEAEASLVNTCIKGVLDYSKVSVLQSTITLNQLDILSEIMGSSEYDQEIMNELEEKYLGELTPYLWDAFQDLLYEAVKSGSEEVLKYYFPIVGQISLAIDAGIIMVGVVDKSLGVSDGAMEAEICIMLHPIVDAARAKMMEYINAYILSDYRDSLLADKIYSLYYLLTGLQIYYNENAIACTDNAHTKFILQAEIDHLKSTSITDWKVNPYYYPQQVDKPDYSELDTLDNGYYYKILLEGYSNIDDDGLLGGWDDLISIEKRDIANEVEALIDFAKNKVTHMYFIETALQSTSGDYKKDILFLNGSWKIPLRVLFVNEEGEGLLFSHIQHNVRHKAYGNNKKYFKSFNVISAYDVERIINGNPSYMSRALPKAHYLTNRMDKNPYGENVYYIGNEATYRYICGQTSFNDNYYEVTDDGYNDISTDNYKSVPNRYFRYNLEGEKGQELYREFLDSILCDGRYSNTSSTSDFMEEWRDILCDVFGKELKWMEPTFDAFAQHLVGKKDIVEVRP